MWKETAPDDFRLNLTKNLSITVYLSLGGGRWQWYMLGENFDVRGRADTEAEAKAAAIAKARELLAAKRDELDKALAVLNAAATLEPTP